MTNAFSLLSPHMPQTPKGKRAVRSNIWGNLVGYVGGRRFWEFGTNGSFERAQALEWLHQTQPNDDIEYTR